MEESGCSRHPHRPHNHHQALQASCCHPFPDSQVQPHAPSLTSPGQAALPTFRTQAPTPNLQPGEKGKGAELSDNDFSAADL